MLSTLSCDFDMVIRGVDFLVNQQSAEGYWHDYDLEVGSARAWTTAYVVKSLCATLKWSDTTTAIEKACRAIERIKTNKGWGYNLVTAEDADSTAWCVRAFQQLESIKHDARALLQPYIGTQGDVRTFQQEDFGSWNEEHLDVATVVGIALLEHDPHCEVALLIAQRIHHCFQNTGQLLAFWWETPFYSWSHALEFYQKWNASHKISKRMAREFLSLELDARSVFEKTLSIKAHYHAQQILGNRRNSEGYDGLIEEITSLQNHDGSWASSAFMRVPVQHSTETKPLVAVDQNRLMTTATVISVIAEVF